MNAKTYLLSAATFIAMALVTFGILRLLNYGNTSLIFVMASIAGLFAVAWNMHSAESDWFPGWQDKLSIGLFLASISLVLAFVLQLIFQPFPIPIVVYVISPIGVLIFPFIILNQFVKAYAKSTKSKKDV